ncbi:regulator of nucleoside diphosphate kinase [Escherichia coli]|nr:regulator of nucleoside diphosphate kinase [Escherichia coli]STF27642.1 regulator of nucleoside diphosphate kinase [Escherichia coli]
MSRPTIIINDLDAERIDILLEQPAYAGLPIADALNAELDRAQMCSPEEMPHDVVTGFAPIFPDICYHLTHYKPAAADIPVASDNPAHYADAIRYNARTPLQGSLLPLTRLVWA